MSAGWKQRLVRSLHLSRSEPEARFFQLATVDGNGNPDNRTLVFRGWENDGNGLLAVTDWRSDKIPQLLANPTISIAWYFAKTREQYRINGTAQIWVTEAQYALQRGAADHPALLVKDTSSQWSQMSDAGRQQFFWPHPKQPLGETSEHGNMADMSEHFSVLCFHPQHVQYLDLKPSPQLRELYDLREGEWTCQKVNP